MVEGRNYNNSNANLVVKIGNRTFDGDARRKAMAMGVDEYGMFINFIDRLHRTGRLFSEKDFIEGLAKTELIHEQLFEQGRLSIDQYRNANESVACLLDFYLNEEVCTLE